jgi:hypothetical protein
MVVADKPLMEVESSLAGPLVATGLKHQSDTAIAGFFIVTAQAPGI